MSLRLSYVCAVPTKTVSITRYGCETETNYWKYARRLLCERPKLLCSISMFLRVLWSRRQYPKLLPSNPTSLTSWLYWRIHKLHIRTQSSSLHYCLPTPKNSNHHHMFWRSSLQKQHDPESMRARSSSSRIQNKQWWNRSMERAPRNLLP